MKVDVIDHGWNAIMFTFKELAKNRMVAKVGVQGAKGDEDHGGLTNATLGSIHEYGSTDGRIPARPHWRAVYDANIGRYQKELAKIAGKFTNEKDLIGGLTMVAEGYKADVLKYLKTGVEARGKVRHLKRPDGGQYWNSFSVVIQK